MQELPDGYALRYDGSETWQALLDEFAECWRRTCPFFSIDVFGEPESGTLRLEIRGPEGTKNFVEGAHSMLTSTLNPAPSRMQTAKWHYAGLTSWARSLPDFLIIGAKKCGTTSLYAYLIQHPDVATAFRKEVNFFNHKFSEGMRWYRRHFPTVFRKTFHRLVTGKPLLTGEATPDYLFFPDACEHIAALLPRARLLAILRNPVDRAYSAYQHQVRLGMESLSFEGAFRAEHEKAKTKKKVKGTYLGRGVYADYLERWFDRFPRDQILVVSTEELENSPAETYRRATSFLGLRDHSLSSYKKFNAIPYPSMAAETREELEDYYRPHNERLYEMLGRDLGWDRHASQPAQRAGVASEDG
jgi:hypothetical protein